MGFGIPNDFETSLGKGLEPVDIIETEEITPEITEEAIDKTDVVEETIIDKKPIEKPELTDDDVLSYFKNKGRDVKTVDELFTEKVKEVNKYEGLIDEDDDAYFKFKKETGRTRKDFEYLKEDFTKVSALELARDRVRQDTGLKLTDAKADAYLEKKLGIDLSENELDTNDEIELNAYSKQFRDSLIADQEKYRTPLEKVTQAKAVNDVEMVQLENGQKIPKSDYDAFTKTRNEYLKNIEQAVNRVTASDFKVIIDDNGDKKEVNFSYEHSKDDRHSMLSDASDPEAAFVKRYQSKDGFNHQALSESMWWGLKENQQKVITAVAQQVRAQTIEEMMESDNNVNFSHKSLQKSNKTENGYGSLTGEQTSGFGVQFNGF